MSHESKLNPKPIFPDIQYERKINRVELETNVRIFRNSKYYTLCYKETVSFPLGEIVDPCHIAKAYQRIITNVYLAIHHHEISNWDIVDTIQISEAERLEKLYPFFSIKQVKKENS